MKLFKKSDSKKVLAYLIVMIAPLFSAFRGPVLNEKNGTLEPGATNIIYQSRDGGKTWKDISHCLPINQEPEDFFVGESDLYLRVNNEMFRSKSELKDSCLGKSECSSAKWFNCFQSIRSHGVQL